MALLLPNLRQVLKYGSGIKDGATRIAVTALEAWSDELIRRLSKLEQSAGGGVAETRAINTTSPLAGGGDLSSDRTLTVADNSTASKGVVPIAPNDTTKFWRGDASWAVPSAPSFGRLTFAAPSGWGDLVFDGVSVVAGLTPSSGQYIMNQDVFADSITVDAGVTVATDDYRLACTGTLTNNGTIKNNGDSGNNGSGGSGAGGSNGAAGVYATGTSGGAGGTGASTGLGAATTALIRLVPAYTSSSVNNRGGQNADGTAGNVTGRGGGGGGAWCCGSVGGSGGNMTLYSAAFGSVSILDLISGRVPQENSTLPLKWVVSTGGGGGGGTAGLAGGGGGAGGGVVLCSAATIAGSGVFEAKGGNGGNGQFGGSNASGGGGGGGGGLIVLLGNRQGAYATDVSGGTGGLGNQEAAAPTGNGGDGADGYVMELD